MSNPDWDDWPAWTEFVVVGIPPELLGPEPEARGQQPTTDEDDEPERLGSAALAYLDELDD